MKILFVAFEYPPIVGGGSTYNYNLATALADLGNDVCVINGSNEDSIYKHNNLTIYSYKSFEKGRSGIIDLYQGINSVIELIKNYQPDVIHTLHYTENLIVQIANVNFQIPHVTTLNRTPDPIGFPISVNSKWSLYDYVSNKNTDYLIMISNFALNRFMQSCNDIPLINTIVIYPGVDNNIYNLYKNANKINKFRKKIGVSKSDILIFCPMVVRKRKGIDFLIDAVNEYALTQTNKINLLISGLSKLDNEEIVNLEKKLKRVKLVKQQHLSNSEMSLLYKISSVCILPSSSEGLGLVLIESLSCGCPTIACNIPGVNEVIKDGYNGRLVEFDNSKQLSSAIKELISNEHIKNKFIKNGLKTVESQFNIKKQVIQHINVYKKVIKNKRIKIFSIPFKFEGGKLSLFLVKDTNKLLKFSTKYKCGEPLVETSRKFINEKLGSQFVNQDYTLSDRKISKRGYVDLNYYYAYNCNSCQFSDKTFVLLKFNDVRKYCNKMEYAILSKLNDIIKKHND